MSRTPRRYAIHLLLSSGHREVVHFTSLDDFQKWYGGVLSSSEPTAFVNVPISELEGEYLLLRAGSVLGMRIEPIYGSMDD